MINRIKAPAAAVAGMLVLSGCSGLLDVDNPNNLVEEAVRQEAAANGVVNGALWHVSEAFGSVIEAPAVVSDELYWIGSRDAWGALDQGFISDPANEFTDANFPNLGQAVWMSQNAVEVLAGHLANSADPDNFRVDYGRALMFRGLALMTTAEQQSDMTFSYKTVDGPPVSSGSAVLGQEGFEIPMPNMGAVMDAAIASFTEAIGVFVAEGETDLELDATALRMRAGMSRQIMDARGTVGTAIAYNAAVIGDANTVLADGGGDYRYNLSYSAASTDCNMCGNVNNRKENQIDLSLVTVDASNDVDGINLQDPIGGGDDLALIAMLNQWKGGSYTDSGNQYNDLTVSSARLAHLILAEAAAAGVAGVGTFADNINNLRAIDGYTTDYTTEDVVATLQHHRRVNTVLQGLRLSDMYRWGLEPETTAGTDPAAVWAPASDAFLRRGSMLPVTLIEVRANCYLNGLPCAGG